MKTQLPRFEGKVPSAGAMKMNGTTEDRVGCLAYGEEVYFIGKGTVSGIDHTDVKDVFTRVHKVSPSALVLIDRKDGEKMLTEAQMLADERFDVASLFNGDEGKGADGPPPGEDPGPLPES